MRSLFLCVLLLVSFPAIANAETCALDIDCSGGLSCVDGTCAQKKTERIENYCQFDYECGNGRACVNAQCVTDETFSRTAKDACGNDRRCRIDRIKRLNASRRHIDQLQTERRLKNDLKMMQKEKAKQSPRKFKPLVFGLQESRLGPLPSPYIGWTFNGALRLTFDYQFTENDDYSNGVDSFSETHFWTGGVEYFILPSVFSPYLRGGFKYGAGTFNSYSFAGGFGGSSSDVTSRFHAAELGAGFDIQLAIGMHTRLGLVYRPLVYSQAKLGPGAYDPVAKSAMDELFKSCMAFDVIGAFGWAF